PFQFHSLFFSPPAPAPLFSPTLQIAHSLSHYLQQTSQIFCHFQVSINRLLTINLRTPHSNSRPLAKSLTRSLIIYSRFFHLAPRTPNPVAPQINADCSLLIRVPRTLHRIFNAI